MQRRRVVGPRVIAHASNDAYQATRCAGEADRLIRVGEFEDAAAHCVLAAKFLIEVLSQIGSKDQVEAIADAAAEKEDDDANEHV